MPQNTADRIHINHYYLEKRVPHRMLALGLQTSTIKYQGILRRPRTPCCLKILEHKYLPSKRASFRPMKVRGCQSVLMWPLTSSRRLGSRRVQEYFPAVRLRTYGCLRFLISSNTLSKNFLSFPDSGKDIRTCSPTMQFSRLRNDRCPRMIVPVF